MKILKFSAENFKRISVVEITPKGNLVQITGKNMQGKTSVLDAIWVTLGGADGMQSVPIRRGEDKATLKLTLGGDKVEMTVTRTIRLREDGTYTTTLTVENADGFRAPSPQKMLDTFLGALAFDPLAFTRMKPRDQFEELRQFVPEVDFDEIARENDLDYQERTTVNRDAKKARTAAEMVDVPDSIDAETQPVDEAALTEELAGAGVHNASIETRKARRTKLQEEIDAGPVRLAAMQKNINDLIKSSQDRTAADVKHIEEDIARLQAKIVTINKDAEAHQNKVTAEGMIGLANVRKQIADLQATLDNAEPLPEPIDTQELTGRIATARWTNAAIRKREERAKQIAEAERLEAEADRLTAAMQAREGVKAEAIANAKLPVEGLGFGDGEVTIKGLPFNQASDAEQLRTSIAIAMAANPKLRVIRVRDGSLLDDDGMALLAAMADEKDYQVWVEKVSNDGKVGFVLEDGHLQGVEPPPPTEKKAAKKPRDRSQEQLV